MATALMAWLSAPAPTTCTSTDPDCRTTPAMAPATEFGFDLLDTLRISIVAPNPSMGVCCLIRRFVHSHLPDGSVDSVVGGIVWPAHHRASANWTIDRGSVAEGDGLV